jgi:hypothetical protein
MSVRARAASAIEETAMLQSDSEGRQDQCRDSRGALAPAMNKDHDLSGAAVAAYNVLYLDTARSRRWPMRLSPS